MRGRRVDGASGADGQPTLVAALLERAAREPDREAYRFLEEPDGSPRSLTLDGLVRLARSVGSSLASAHEPGTRVLLVLPAGRPFLLGFLGCSLSGMVPVPAAAPSRTRIAQGLVPLEAIAADCRPAAVLCTQPIGDAVREAIAPASPFEGVVWHHLETAVRADPTGWDGPPVAADQLAFVQYTSGSTASPRGVAVTHANLMANLRTIHRAFATGAQDHAVVWLPPHHDMGLVGGLLTPLTGGFDVTLLAPQDFVQSPVRWLRAITASGGTISGGPDFAYRLCADRIRDDQLDGLDLRSWRLAFTGAEPVSPQTLAAFADRFRSVGFDPAAIYPCYGLAESTLFVSGGTAGVGAATRAFSRRGLTEGVAVAPSGAGDARALVSNGRAIDVSTEIRIVDPATSVTCPAGAVGEIWVRGPSVASGYLGHPTATATTFDAHDAAGEGPFLRTGDLGCQVDGDLYVTGRLKDTIVVEGRCLDAHDLEEAVRGALPDGRLGLTAALSSTELGHERLVIVQEVGRSTLADAPDLGRAIRAAVAARSGVRPDEIAMVPVGALPRTTSGKLRRAEAARRLADGTLTRLGPPAAARAAEVR